MNKIVQIALKDIEININDEALEYLIISSSWCKSNAYTSLNFAYKVSKDIDIDLLKS